MDGDRVVVNPDINADRQALDANRRRAVELELKQADAEILAHLRHAGEQPRPVPLKIAQGCDRRSDAAWVPAVGRVKGPAVLLHRRRDRRGCDHRANRRQSAAHRFRDTQHVGVQVEVLAREQPTSPAETAGDFIGDEQRAVTAAQVTYPPDGVFLWNQDAEIDADRLHDERGDVAPLQSLLDAAQCLRVEGRCDLAAVRQQVLRALAVVGRADAQPGKRVAVVTAFERQQCAASRVDHRRLQGEVDRL